MSTSEKVDAHTLEAMKAVRDYCIKNGMPVPSVVEQNIAHEESKAMKAVRDYCIKNGIAVPNVIEQNIGTHEDKNVNVHEDMAKDVLVAENELIFNLEQNHSKNDSLEKIKLNSENGMAKQNIRAHKDKNFNIHEETKDVTSNLDATDSPDTELILDLSQMVSRNDILEESAANTEKKERNIQNSETESYFAQYDGNWHCNKCIKKFSTTNDMKIHVNKVHKDFMEINKENEFEIESNTLSNAMDIDIDLFGDNTPNNVKSKFEIITTLDPPSQTRDGIKKRNDERFKWSKPAYDIDSSSLEVFLEVKKQDQADGLANHNQNMENNIVQNENNHERPYIATEKDDLSTIHEGNNQKYKCDKCDKIFKFKLPWENHMISMVHYECKHCQKGFTNIKKFEYHLKVVHNVVNICECKICGKPFRRNKYLRRHLRVTHGGEKYPCKKCDKTYSTKSMLRNHIEMVHEGKIIEKEKCDKCGKFYQGKTSLRYHIYTSHSNKQHKCNICNKILRFRGSLLYHIRTLHEGQKAEKCQLCEKSFSTKGLKKHAKLQHSCKCDHCNLMFVNLSYLKYHLKKSHDLKPEIECKGCLKKFDKFKIPIRHQMFCQNKSTRRKCEYCIESFSHKKYLTKHQRQMHREEVIHECDICGYVNFRKDYFARHMGKKHDEKCERCDKRFIKNFELQEHLKTVHGISPPESYICSFCDKIMTKIDVFKGHISLKHLHKCDYCDKSFIFTTLLDLHMKTSHEMTPETQCKTCDQKFKNSYYLKWHHKCKGSEVKANRLFECNLCEKKYTKSHNLKLHISIVHEGKIREKKKRFPKEEHKIQTFKCRPCNISYKEKQHLKNHFKNVHNDWEYTCDMCGKDYGDESTLTDHKKNMH